MDAPSTQAPPRLLGSSPVGTICLHVVVGHEDNELLHPENAAPEQRGVMWCVEHVFGIAVPACRRASCPQLPAGTHMMHCVVRPVQPQLTWEDFQDLGA